MGKAKKVGIGIGVAVLIVIVIFGVFAALETMRMADSSELLDDLIEQCYDNFPDQPEEIMECRQAAKEKFRELVNLG